MAGLSSSAIVGFISSGIKMGEKIVESFLSGFSGHGWKIWEYVKGKWKLEIDTIVVRETMLVFEMLISKIRAIIGAQAITQGHGKVKSARLSDDGTEYIIELEDEDVSIVAHDFIRCQTFVGDKTKLYHVEVSSVDVETKTLHVPLSEFDKDESGNVLNVPAAGDELIQFGNSQNKARQSAIYMHADETGQPAIDVMFDLDSKNWEGKVKVRMGGNIPGGNGLKGFYSVNGMVKAVDDKGAVIYELSPDGSVNLGKGNIRYNPTTDKVTLGSGVTLTWNNLDDESKENLKGEPGKDGEDGKDGNDGLDIIWKGDSSTPPVNPVKNWVYRNTSDGRVYIYTGTAWALMVADGNDGTDGEPGTDGKDGMRVYITYNDGEGEPEKPIGDGTTNGWHTNSTASVIWISQKVAESADLGIWGDPIRIKGEAGKDANLLPWIEKWNGYATELGEEYIVTPKMFSGTKTVDSEGKVLLTGIAQGKDCLTAADGTKRTGIFALVDNEIVFALDPILKEYLFTGQIKIANNKIILNQDGSGHLASGNLNWDSIGNISISGALQTPYTSMYIEQSTTYLLDIEKHRYVFVSYRRPIYDKDDISRINLPDVIEGRNGAEIRIFTSGERFTQDTEPVYIQYGLPIWYPGYNYYKDPPLHTLLLKGKEAVFRCMKFDSAVGWWLQNYNDFTAEERNPIQFNQ